MRSRKGGYGAGCSEGAGRVIEPRNEYSCGPRRITVRAGERESRRFAAPGRQQSRSRYAKDEGHHRGLRAGHALTGVTRELERAICLLVTIAGRGGVPADQEPWRREGASPRATSREEHKQEEADKGAGSERRAKRPERGSGQS